MFRKRSYNTHDEINVVMLEKRLLTMQRLPLWFFSICGGRLFS